MDIAALHDIVHKSRDARRSQTLPKISLADRETLIKKYHPDHREQAYRPIKFGPNAGDLTVRELASVLEGDSPVPLDLPLTPDYTVDVLVVGGGGAGYVSLKGVNVRHELCFAQASRSAANPA